MANKTLNIDTFGEIIDGFLRDNTIHMMVTLPEGTLEPKVRDNTGMGSVMQFYILLNAIKPICKQMQEDLGGIDSACKEWEKTVDGMLERVKREIMEESSE